MNKFFACLLLTTAFSAVVLHRVSAQAVDTLRLTLAGVVDMAQMQSIAAKRAETIKENRYWQYRQFKANLAPQLALSGDFPDYTRAYSPVRQPGGSIEYFLLNQMNSNSQLSLQQSIAATGTQIFVSSSLNRFDDFAPTQLTDSTFTPSVIYNSTPVGVGFSQPLFAFNRLKWDKKVEPLRYEESTKQFAEDMENISVEATGFYFDVLLAQIQLQIASKNLANNDTIYQIGKGRYNLGKIPENDLLQMEIQVLTAQSNLSQAELDFETAILRLKTFIGLGTDGPVKLAIPGNIPSFIVDSNLALEMAKENRADAVGFLRDRIEADRDYAQAKGDAGLNLSVNGFFGTTARGETLGAAYERDGIATQQVAGLSFSIPIVDWGRQQASLRTAEANRQLVDYEVQQAEITFEQEVITAVRQFDLLRNQLEITKKRDDIAQRRYDIARKRFLIGKITVTDLNNALRDKDDAKETYVSSLRQFWNSYYSLRRLTLYDFSNGQDLYKGNVQD